MNRILKETFSRYDYFTLEFQVSVQRTASLVPRLPQNVNMYCGESLVSFLCKHDVIEKGLKQKASVLHVV